MWLFFVLVFCFAVVGGGGNGVYVFEEVFLSSVFPKIQLFFFFFTFSSFVCGKVCAHHCVCRWGVLEDSL